MVVGSFEASSARCAIGASIAVLALLLAGCASEPVGGGGSGLPQPSFSFEDLPSSETARPPKPPRAARPAAEASPAEASSGAAPAVVTLAARPTGTPLDEARRLRRAGDKHKALALLDRAAESGAGDPAIGRERGLLALELGHLDRARPLLEQAAGAAPGDWRVHSALGVALAAEGRQQQAQLAFARALELAPDHPTVLNNLALSYALDGKHEQAETLLRRAARAHADRPQAKQNLALIQSLKGQGGTSKSAAASRDQDGVVSGRDAAKRTALGASDGAATVFRLGGPLD